MYSHRFLEKEDKANNFLFNADRYVFLIGLFLGPVFSEVQITGCYRYLFTIDAMDIVHGDGVLCDEAIHVFVNKPSRRTISIDRWANGAKTRMYDMLYSSESRVVVNI